MGFKLSKIVILDFNFNWIKLSLFNLPLDINFCRQTDRLSICIIGIGFSGGVGQLGATPIIGPYRRRKNVVKDEW